MTTSATDTATVKAIEPAFLDGRESARFIGWSKRMLDYARAEGRIPYYRLGGKCVFKVDDLMAFMEPMREMGGDQ